jgi:transcriptional regulator with XRE-family HTH domain
MLSEQFKFLPNSPKLKDTLAQRIAQLRELRNMTVRDLAEVSRFSIQRIEDIEAGLETWFSTTERQLIARALVVEPNVIKEVERRPSFEEGQVPTQVLSDLTQSILDGARDLECPLCGSTLKCSIQEGIDLENRPIHFARAFCTKCPFVLR